jgi:hypothetical protein
MIVGVLVEYPELLPNLFITLAATTGSAAVSTGLYFRSDRGHRRPLDYVYQLLIAPLWGGAAASLFEVQTLPLAFLVGAAFPLIIRAITAAPNAFEDQRTLDLRKSLSRAEAAVEKDPEKTRPVWDLSRVQLELYITRNLAQVRNIFWITVAVMGAGFGLVVYGIYRAFDSRLEVAILTAGAGIITQTIGATFLLIYRSTMSQANDYVGTLERINAVGMAVQIVDLIPDESKDLKNKARVDLVKLILGLPKKPTAH